MKNSTVVGRVTAAAMVAAAVGAVTLAPAAAEPAEPGTTTTAPQDQQQIPCTPLHVVAFQGTGQSGEQSDPTTDSGFLGQTVTLPLLREAPGVVSRQMVPYAADFGFHDKPYAESMTGGVAAGIRTISAYAQRCPSSMIALVGYSQGAEIADELARMIGSGNVNAPVRSDRVAAVSLFSSPIREDQSAVFPGAPQRLSPAVPSGLDQSLLSQLLLTSTTPTVGGGIAPALSTSTGYGQLTGRVASWCAGGDVACSTPKDAPLARTIANLGGQIHFSAQDPLRTVSDIATALGGSVLRTAAGVINNDINFSNGKFSINNSGTTVLGRLAQNSDPRSATPAADNDVIRAVIKAGVMGFSAAVTVAQKVLTPANIASLVAVGMTNPVGALGDLGIQLAGAVLDMVPPATISAGVRYIFNEVTRDVSDNAGLVQMATDLRYWNSGAQHTSYDVAQVGADGQTPTQYTVQWLSALAKALDKKAGASSTTVRPTTATSSVPGR
ncbi:cutinase family protein [Nocardia amamiensis]|uniref:cutinase family protein n=1 Tax=Nocardia amamiensis TaxID=404578 RepID=UPI000A04CABA|nr:cutinase family protein [Nocardia amamiensis]